MKTYKTYITTKSDPNPEWHLIDATGEILGRLASKIAVKLLGKDKPTYTPHVLSGDYIVVVNASKIRVTGRKLSQKTYYRHSGYIGSLKTFSLRDMMEKHPERVIKLAVKGMLPSNHLGRQMLKRLKVYSGETNPHNAQLQSISSEE